MKLHKKNRKNKGFTLIELIVVVSIVLILSGFLVPKVLGYQDKAKNAKAVNTARQIFDTSMESYTEEEGNLDQTKISSSILAVTGLTSTELTVGAPDTTNGTVTITFSSDKKTYDVNVTAKENKFSVSEVTATSPTRELRRIYINKDE